MLNGMLHLLFEDDNWGQWLSADKHIIAEGVPGGEEGGGSVDRFPAGHVTGPLYLQWTFSMPISSYSVRWGGPAVSRPHAVHADHAEAAALQHCRPCPTNTADGNSSLADPVSLPKTAIQAKG